MSKLIAAVILFTTLWFSAALGSKPLKEKPKDVRLPRHLRPDKYKVDLIPFIIPDNFTIRGHVEITMICDFGSSDNVTVHIAEMNITESSVSMIEQDSGREIYVSGHEYDKDREFYIARLGETLEQGKTYVISMDFVAILRDGLRGFYRSQYKNERGESVYLATTQFQATDARRAFPCFDEPAIKAKFEISLGRTRNMSSISNMPIKSGGKGIPVEGDDNYVWDHYEESVAMSTYLLAFVVSDFEYAFSPPTGNNVKFRIWARKNALDQIDFAKSVGAKMLKYFEEYFDVKYPLPKQDMIAIPDFSAGAMENWGLITYRETALLFKPGVSTSANKQRIAIVISHELAHQWFGNLVTPSWWTDLWLNEGFASYVEYLGVEAVVPEFHLMEQFVVVDLQSVMRIDALESSHPISIPVNHPDEISEIFDRISYSKGASIIRMMDHFLTTKTFRKGLTNYLNAFAYKAAEQDDLWQYLTEQAHRDGTLPSDVTVKTIMDTWTLQMGLPVITVTRDYKKNSATVSQARYLTSNNANSKDDHDYQWWVPLTFMHPGGNWSQTYSKLWLKPHESAKKVSGLPDAETAVVFNVQETGYYRTNYDEKNWRLLAKQLEQDHTQIHVINRAQIIDDAFNLARAGLLDYNLAMGVTSYLSQETEYIVWKAALSGFKYIEVMLRRTAAYGEFKNYLKKLVMPLFRKVGFEARENEEHLNVLLRINAVSWACDMGIPECRENTVNKFREWMDSPYPDQEDSNPVDVNMKSVVYCNALADGDEDEWDFTWQRYNNSNVGTEKNLLLRAMACTEEIWLLNRYLNMSLYSESGIRQQDGRSVIASVSGNTYGRDLAFDFIRDNWDRIVEYYAGSSFALPGLLRSVLSSRNTQFELNELLDFQSDNADTLGTGTREIKQAIEKATNNLNWMDKNYLTVFDWLKEQNN